MSGNRGPGRWGKGTRGHTALRGWASQGCYGTWKGSERTGTAQGRTNSPVPDPSSRHAAAPASRPLRDALRARRPRRGGLCERERALHAGGWRALITWAHLCSVHLAASACVSVCPSMPCHHTGEGTQSRMGSVPVLWFLGVPRPEGAWRQGGKEVAAAGGSCQSLRPHLSAA